MAKKYNLAGPRGVTVTIDLDETEIEIDGEEMAEAIRAEMADDYGLVGDLVRLAIAAGLDVQIESGETEQEDRSESSLPRDRRVASRRVYRLLVDDIEVAALTREGWSYYGDLDHPATPAGEWTTEPGEEDRGVPDAWAEACRAADLRGGWQYVPGAAEREPVEPAVDDDGEYCLWWSTVGDDDGPRTDARYATLSDAESASQLAEHALRLRHRGTLLRGYGIGQLVAGEWVRVEVAD